MKPAQPSGLRRKLISQFHRPHGFLGILAGTILAKRKSGLQRNAWTVELLNIQADERVLELGFGPGVSIQAASERAFQGYVAGVDHSETMVRMASRRNAHAIRQGRVELHEASIDALPSFDAPFDKVFAINALQFSNEPLAVLNAIRERMKVGGLIAITLESRKPGATDADSVRGAEDVGKLMEQVGFDRLRIETLPLQPVCAACALAKAC